MPNLIGNLDRVAVGSSEYWEILGLRAVSLCTGLDEFLKASELPLTVLHQAIKVAERKKGPSSSTMRGLKFLMGLKEKEESDNKSEVA